MICFHWDSIQAVQPMLLLTVQGRSLGYLGTPWDGLPKYLLINKYEVRTIVIYKAKSYLFRKRKKKMICWNNKISSTDNLWGICHPPSSTQRNNWELLIMITAIVFIERNITNQKGRLHLLCQNIWLRQKRPLGQPVTI